MAMAAALSTLVPQRADRLLLAAVGLCAVAAVFGAYGWPRDLSDDEILARLLALNLERAKGWGEAPPAAGAEGDEEEAEG